jgi:hypothetical protein
LENNKDFWSKLTLLRFYHVIDCKSIRCVHSNFVCFFVVITV